MRSQISTCGRSEDGSVDVINRQTKRREKPTRRAAREVGQVKNENENLEIRFLRETESRLGKRVGHS
jgi:hypothetical protein